METGLYHNGFRDYLPALGRYLESDPIGLAGGFNTYAYAGGNPLRYSSPLGLCTVSDAIAPVNELAAEPFDEFEIGEGFLSAFGASANIGPPPHPLTFRCGQVRRNLGQLGLQLLYESCSSRSNGPGYLRSCLLYWAKFGLRPTEHLAAVLSGQVAGRPSPTIAGVAVVSAAMQIYRERFRPSKGRSNYYNSNSNGLLSGTLVVDPTTGKIVPR